MGRGGCSTRARYLTRCSRGGGAAGAGSPGLGRRRRGGFPHHGPRHGTGMPFGWFFLIFGSFSWTGRGPLDGEGATGRGPGSQRRLCHAKPPLQRGRWMPTWVEAPSRGWRDPGALPAPEGWWKQPDPTSRHGTHSRAWSRGEHVPCLSLPACIRVTGTQDD